MTEPKRGELVETATEPDGTKWERRWLPSSVPGLIQLQWMIVRPTAEQAEKEGGERAAR